MLHIFNTKFRKLASICILSSVMIACITVGPQFKSDTSVLSHIIAGETTLEKTIQLLDSKPYIRYNLENGNIACVWQRMAAYRFGEIDNRVLTLEFASSDEGSTWYFQKVLQAKNVDLPASKPSDENINENR